MGRQQKTRECSCPSRGRLFAGDAAGSENLFPTLTDQAGAVILKLKTIIIWFTGGPGARR